MSQLAASFQTLQRTATLATISEPDQQFAECLEAMLKLEQPGAELEDGE
ncbi:MAG: hypothetical protein ABJZ55_15305 [Fuerstiella sp.]